MQFPVVRGVIDRRILVNFRVDPDVLARQLPQPFRPKLVKGEGMAGICLIRLKAIRPRFVPAFDDGHAHVLVDGHASQEMPAGSVFSSLKEASDFFEAGALGYSVTARPDQFDGLELHSFAWQVTPLAVDKVESSFFENAASFPPDSVQFDCALLMRGIEHEWLGRGRLCA